MRRKAAVHKLLFSPNETTSVILVLDYHHGSLLALYHVNEKYINIFHWTDICCLKCVTSIV